MPLPAALGREAREGVAFTDLSRVVEPVVFQALDPFGDSFGPS